MSARFGKFARVCMWVLLVCTLMLDANIGECAISTCTDVFSIGKDGTWMPPGGDPSLWLPIGALILIQAGLVLALIRLRPQTRRDGLLPR